MTGPLHVIAPPTPAPLRCRDVTDAVAEVAIAAALLAGAWVAARTMFDLIL